MYPRLVSRPSNQSFCLRASLSSSASIARVVPFAVAAMHAAVVAFAAVVVLAAGVFVAGAFFPAQAFAETGDQSQVSSPYNHEITLAPGSQTDVTKAERATLYIIDKAGSYTLSGQTCSAHVTVRTGDVKLYLADGLSITPDYTPLLQAAIALQSTLKSLTVL